MIPHTFRLTAANDAFAFEPPPLTRDHGALPFTSPIVVIQHDPIMRHAELVRPRRIGNSAVYCRSPRWVCHTGSHASPVGLKRRGAMVGSTPAAALPDIPIDVQQFANLWLVRGMRRMDSSSYPPKPGGDRIDDPGQSFRRARRVREAKCRRTSQIFGCIDAKVVMQPSRQHLADARNRGQSASASDSPRSRWSIGSRPVVTRVWIERAKLWPIPESY